jgi:nitrogen fixation protein NifB
MMRHCRQCRADAVGLLGEDRGEEFTMDKIENMEIDYAAAMEMRREVHEGIAEELKAKEEAKKQNVVKLETSKKYRPVLMAVATSGGGVINQHFGHAREFLVYEASSEGVRFINHRKADQYCEGDVSCGDGETVLQRTIKSLIGCEAVLCSKVGFEPWAQLEEAGVMPNNDYPMEPIEEAVMKHYKKMIEDGLLDEVSDEQQASA